MPELFDDPSRDPRYNPANDSQYPPHSDQEDFLIKQAQEAAAESQVEVTLKTITPQKLENSKSHEFLSRDALLSNLSSTFDVEVGTMYHALASNLQWMELIESAQSVDSEHTAWLDHSVGVGGFGRRLLSTTTIDRTQKVIKQNDSTRQGGMRFE